MALRIAIHHHTHYAFDRLVSLSPHVFRLRPAPHCRIPIESYSLIIKPSTHFINWQQDPFGNYLARVIFPEQTHSMTIDVEIIAEMAAFNPFDFFTEPYAENYPFEYEATLRQELLPYLEIREDGPLLREWLNTVDRSKKNINDFLVELNHRLCNDIRYSVRMEPGVQTCEQTLGLTLGSCRDSGWLLVQILRHLGLAARFVSGYLVQLVADQKALDGPSGPEADFTDLHAWAEVYIPGAGWIGLDPTSGLFAGEGHIPLACTPNPESAAPVSGFTDVCETEFSFSNTVERIHEDPRVTKPYTEEQWAAVMALGDKVDEDLAKGDVRMTMGGEPTFVSIDDMEAPEWNTAADGVHKRKLAGDLVKRLRDSFGSGGLLHYSQGKWYPGESLPRWQLGLHWRKDGLPIWRNPGLVAEDGKDNGFTHESAEKFTGTLARYLGVAAENTMPAYEDIFYFLWEEGKLPVNVDPLKANLKDPLVRRSLAALLERGLEKPTGYVLPIKWNFSHDTWQSNPWEFSRGQLFLIPGNSPMGLRLPLESLPFGKPDPEVQRSLFDELPSMGNFTKKVQVNYRQTTSGQTTAGVEVVTENKSNGKGKSETEYDDFVRTALCVETREGRLHVFMPPLSYAEQYLELVAAVEATAETLQMPVRLEGYEPPRDWRIEQMKVTPDPGVVEVNIHPSSSWKEMVNNTHILYEQARLARLGTEKFMLDGRHTGTGGGNHITIGAAKPVDSPLLRRPDLLRSLITYWQHHPGLSYLFSSAFIGPTSQAPRVDEGRDEKLYELEIAFDQIPEGESVPSWLVDRLFRHLLTDITGNTHRAEFCIDKLYSPDSSSGRLGILEFRAFDMPPHERMSLVQMLLIRSLIAWFWQTPYRHKLVRWGTELHDRFLLPHYAHDDLRDVVDDLNRAGYPFDMSWLEPFFEFRFPHYGRVQFRNIELEIRMAIEPWHVLGEEMSNSGTARYVDSSLERIQLKINGLTDSRYVVVCNRCRIPLKNTGVKGEYVAGVRYRAWQPPSALHPTIGVDVPLVFDIVDTWNGRSIGGCTYHVSHPGGRSYENFPVNSLAAEARRVTRFWDTGHTPGPLEPSPDLQGMSRFFTEGQPPRPMEPPKEEINEEYPFTLDLRKYQKKG